MKELRKFILNELMQNLEKYPFLKVKETSSNLSGLKTEIVKKKVNHENN